MSESLQSKASKGIFWNSFERFSVQGVTFLIQLVLARLLAPSDYGIIGMLAIFMQLAQVFVESGLSSALIQKKECTQDDLSTTFYYNLVVSILIYVILFVFAPYISAFYGNYILVPMTRVLSVNIIINALFIIQKTILDIHLDFKTQFQISFISVVLSGIIGIILAIRNYGIWALCVQQIANSSFQCLFYFWKVRWAPSARFNLDSFKYLFHFGSKLLLSRIINTIYRNLYNIVIGKRFSSNELGNFTRAEQFAMFPSANLGQIISRVSFPLLSKLQDDEHKLYRAYQTSIRLSSFIIFPLMFTLIALSRPLVLVLLSEKWAGVIPLLQILCLDWMLDHISALNLNLLYVKGRTDLALKLEVIKKAIAIFLLLVSIPWGIYAICFSRVVYSLVATYINTYYTNRYIGLSFRSQMKEILPFILASVTIVPIVFFMYLFVNNVYLQIVFGAIASGGIYLLLTYVFFKQVLKQLVSLILCKS